jgi:hypothetical protein
VKSRAFFLVPAMACKYQFINHLQFNMFGMRLGVSCFRRVEKARADSAKPRQFLRLERCSGDCAKRAGMRGTNGVRGALIRL